MRMPNPPSGPLVRYDLLIQGRVQGVGFRWFASRKARQLGITGWIRNLEDGSVEMEVQGEPERVERLLVLLQEGNGFSQVDRICKGSLSPVPEREFVVLSC